MPGVQTLVPIMLEHVHAGRLTADRRIRADPHVNAQDARA
jgi:dihydroorotase-like cyclic amidohydrolase